VREVYPRTDKAGLCSATSSFFPWSPSAHYITRSTHTVPLPRNSSGALYFLQRSNGGGHRPGDGGREQGRRRWPRNWHGPVNVPDLQSAWRSLPLGLLGLLGALPPAHSTGCSALRLVPCGRAWSGSGGGTGTCAGSCSCRLDGERGSERKRVAFMTA
jgi:hypothetical protein